MDIWVAIIKHKHGQYVMASHTPKGLDKQIHAYVTEYWDDFVSKTEKPTGYIQRDIRTYFKVAYGDECIAFFDMVGVTD